MSTPTIVEPDRITRIMADGFDGIERTRLTIEEMRACFELEVAKRKPRKSVLQRLSQRYWHAGRERERKLIDRL